MKFTFDEYHTLCQQQPQNEIEEQEIHRRHIMENIAKSLVQQMGGEILPP